MNNGIVHIRRPMIVVGGANLGPDDLNIPLIDAPRFVAADGGADHLLAAGIAPEAVIGDFDSLSDAARNAFGAVLQQVDEQDSTDFEKVVTRVDAPFIVAAGFLGGRLDHTFAALNVLARYPEKRILLIGPDDVCFLVRREQAVLEAPLGCRIALLPMGNCVVTTSGLEWNLKAAMMAPGGLISPSNRVADVVASVTVTGPLIVSLERAGLEAALAAVRAE